MTHGVGRISHGRGSRGGSGGRVSSGSNGLHSHGRRNSSKDDEDVECVVACCCILCFLTLFLLCVIEIKPRTRIILAWFYCILGTGLTGGLLARHYSSVHISASPGDIRIVESPSALCQSVLIESSSPITTYRFESMPKINKTSSVKYEHRDRAFISSDMYEYWGFYLLEGSGAAIYVCPDDNMTLYIINGKDNLDAWIDNGDCAGSFKIVHSISNCSSRIHAEKYEISSSNSNQYYFVLANYGILGSESIDVNVDFNIDRKVYDMHGSSIVCSRELACNVSIPLTGSVVFYVPSDSSFDTDVTFHCRPRVYMYIIIFAILPITFGTLVTLLIIQRLRKSRPLDARSDSQCIVVSSSDQLHGHANECCQINTSTPSYT